MKRKRIVGIIVLMLSLAVFCLAACQPQTREVEAVEPEPTTLAQSGSTERDPGFFRLFGGFCGRDSGIGPAQRAKTTIWN